MAAVNLVSGALMKLFIQYFEQIMLDLNGLPAGPADEVVVVVTGGLVNQPAIADMSNQRQAVVCQEIQRAVNRCFSQPGHAPGRALEDHRREKMPAILFQDIQYGQALWGEAEAAVP